MSAEIQAEILALFRETGVLLSGHFLLTSGQHSPLFLQCSQVMQYPDHAAYLARLLAAPFREAKIQTVIGPAMGGIILAHEVARQLGARALFAEKADGRLLLRRGFRITRGERVLVVEDAVTTGGSVRRVLQLVRAAGAEPVGVAMLVDRSGGRVDFGVPQRALLELDIPIYAPEACPLCRDGLPLTAPKEE